MDVEEEQIWQRHPAFAHSQQWRETWHSSFTSCPPTVAANQRCCCWPKSQDGCNACAPRCRASWLHRLALASLARGYLDIEWVRAAKFHSGVCIHGALTGQLTLMLLCTALRHACKTKLHVLAMLLCHLLFHSCTAAAQMLALCVIGHELVACLASMHSLWSGMLASCYRWCRDHAKWFGKGHATHAML